MKKIIKILTLLVALIPLLVSCVNQHVINNEKITDDKEVKDELRIVATSKSTLNILELLDLEVIGVTGETIDSKYEKATNVGIAMNPDIEKIALLDPTDVIGPDSLQADLETKYKNANLNYTFLNLRTVSGFYESIELLGKKYHREDLANFQIEKYHEYLDELKESIDKKNSPKVLVLMGFPGAYAQATKNSYVGNLVELTGAVNVVETLNLEEDLLAQDFVYLNTEQLQMLNPDIIVWTSHALRDEVAKMFQEEFAKNGVWKHYDAVKNDKIYQLDDTIINMCANIHWKTAVDDLNKIFYEDN